MRHLIPLALASFLSGCGGCSGCEMPSEPASPTTKADDKVEAARPRVKSGAKTAELTPEQAEARKAMLEKMRVEAKETRAFKNELAKAGEGRREAIEARLRKMQEQGRLPPWMRIQDGQTRDLRRSAFRARQPAGTSTPSTGARPGLTPHQLKSAPTSGTPNISMPPARSIAPTPTKTPAP